VNLGASPQLEEWSTGVMALMRVASGFWILVFGYWIINPIQQFLVIKYDGLVKSHHIDGKVKSSYARRANLEE
jgi:hypothetical protein